MKLPKRFILEHQARYSNCFIEAVKRKIREKQGRVGLGVKKENGHIYFFYMDREGKVYRFARKFYRHVKNNNRIWFKGYVYIELDQNQDYRKLIF